MLRHIIHRRYINQTCNTEGAVDHETASFASCIGNLKLQQVIDGRYKSIEIAEKVTYTSTHRAWQYCFVCASYRFDDGFVSNIIKFINAAVESFKRIFVCLSGATAEE